MKDILTDIYNRMVNFFQNENEEENAKDVAYNRLKLVLTQDRMKLDSISAEKLKCDLINVLSKYMDVKEETYDISFSGEENELAFMFNIGIVRTKSFEEIEKEEKESKEKNEQQDVQTKEEDNVDIEEDEDLKKDDIEETSNEDVDNENSQNSDKDDYDGILIATKDKDGNKIIKSSKKSKEEIV
ncbi:MAG: cell division topological specificity factor MinE [Candidatus Gastranaerophilales bacterium]|nr:cell division topological specificity factor MinE [Candidatus Gastranaerophilales bacterium]